MAREPYKQFMFHFNGRDSIDGRDINDEEIKWCRLQVKHYHRLRNMNVGASQYEHNYRVIIEMFKLWAAEELV